MPVKKGSEAEKRKRLAAKGQRKGAKPPTEPYQSVNLRRERFVAALIADPMMNATAAAIAVGYTAQPAKQAARLMNHPYVKALIAETLGPKMRHLEITADRVLQGLAELAYANILDFGHVTPEGQFCVDLSKMDRVSAGAIASVETETYREGTGDDARMVTRTKLKVADRRPALEALGRHLKILGGAEAGQALEPIQLVIEYMPRPKATEPLNVSDLVEQPRKP
jgi:phage terminase small subunit